MKKIPVRKISSPANEPVITGRFRIRSVNSILNGRDMVQDLHRHDFFFILALQKGKGRHEIDFTSFNIKDNSVFILRPGQVHQLKLKKGAKGFLLEFDNAFYQPTTRSANQRLIKASNKNYCTIKETRFKKLMNILDHIYHEYTEKLDGYNDSIKSHLDIFFIEINRESKNEKPFSEINNSYKQQRFEEFIDLVEKNISSKKQVSQYADQMNLSVYQLNAITNAMIGKPGSVIINEQIVLEAKRLLLATTNQVKDIADSLGYEDISYFIRYFKKHTGFSPEIFRRNFK